MLVVRASRKWLAFVAVQKRQVFIPAACIGDYADLMVYQFVFVNIA